MTCTIVNQLPIKDCILMRLSSENGLACHRVWCPTNMMQDTYRIAGNHLMSTAVEACWSDSKVAVSFRRFGHHPEERHHVLRRHYWIFVEWHCWHCTTCSCIRQRYRDFSTSWLPPTDNALSTLADYSSTVVTPSSARRTHRLSLSIWYRKQLETNTIASSSTCQYYTEGSTTIQHTDDPVVIFTASTAITVFQQSPTHAWPHKKHCRKKRMYFSDELSLTSFSHIEASPWQSEARPKLSLFHGRCQFRTGYILILLPAISGRLHPQCTNFTAGHSGNRRHP